MTRHLVLLGGGHAHLHVLESLARSPLPDVRVTLVSPYRHQIYSGMLPGWIAGHYPLADCTISLDRLAKAAQAEFMCIRACALETASRCVRLADNWTVDYDLLSVDIGSDVRVGPLECASDRLAPVRPAPPFVEHYKQHARSNAGQPVAVIGGGMAGIEIACALRVASGYRADVTLLAGRDGIVPTQHAGLKTRLANALKARGVTIINEDASGFGGTSIETSSGRHVAAMFVVLATGPQAPGLLRNSGLPLDQDGYPKVDASLRSTGNSVVFAAGDCARFLDDSVARSGVYAVRQGPILAHNLRAALMGNSLRKYHPQRRALYLMSTGPRHAIATWGRWTWEGEWVWRWKRHIDRRFVQRFCRP
ncbi:FAD-dependent oxidoreductase [Burkholderia glumae]|uniref:FAD-dependent oxidoreductase n=1 Tax=Burkholderia glumae TaxID=337 RepID=UPI00214F8A82|nr:FAD-dependent oxidoreductase [Burkholderia glumae]